MTLLGGLLALVWAAWRALRGGPSPALDAPDPVNAIGGGLSTPHPRDDGEAWPPLDEAVRSGAQPLAEPFDVEPPDVKPSDIEPSDVEPGAAVGSAVDEPVDAGAPLASGATPRPAPSAPLAQAVEPEALAGDAAVLRDAAGGVAWVEPLADGGCPGTHPVKGKVASGIYHVPGGRSYGRTRPDRCYASAAAAEADGLRPAKR